MAPPLSMRERKKIIKIYTINKYFKRYNKSKAIDRTAKRLLYSERCVRKYVDLWFRTNSLQTVFEKYNITHGRKREYNNGDLLQLQKIIRKNNTLYLDEIQRELIINQRKYFTISKIVRMIKKLNITRKKISKIGLHFNYRNVRIYQTILRLRNIRKDQMVFADESYYHDRIANRNYGRSLRFVLYGHYHTMYITLLSMY